MQRYAQNTVISGRQKADARKPIQKELTTKLEEARSTVKKNREACYSLACKSRLVIREQN